MSKSVQVPALVMLLPMFVMVKVPWASGVQLPESWIVGARVGVIVGVAVGDWQKVEVVAGAVPPPLVSNSSVPKSPEVWTCVDAPAFSWKDCVASGVPLSKSVQLPALVMLLPIFVIVKVPCASGVQSAASCIVGARVGVIVGVAVGD